jgi:hypothetical protein
MVAVALLLGACGEDTRPGQAATDGPKTEIWRPVDSWSGQANAQLGTFSMESFDWRVRWEAVETGPGSSLRVVVHSGDSGRDLAVPVNTNGSGKGVGYVTELPRAFYLTVDATNVEWKLWVDESIGAKPVEPQSAPPSAVSEKP